ncbi:MAG: glycosyltransferase family 2 protein [Bacteroidales bacterium]|nr:glycosyltransferase family 2 protein [Bacteroidales bacterium]MDD4712283.1 glycosyltransferase family 2 protein [Bacteroidales bacterium]
MKTFFWLGAFLVFYTYLGYGILLYVLVKIKEKLFPEKAVPYSEEYPEVTLMIAAYNEESVIHEKMHNCRALQYPKGKLNIYWVTDGSNDKTDELLATYPEVCVLHQPERKGKTAALNRGITFIKTPIVIFTDANTMLNQQAILEIVKSFADPKVGCVAGEKRIKQKETGNATAGEGIYWKYESTLKSLDDRLFSAVGAAGELFAIRTDLFEVMPEDTLLDDFILSMKIAQKGHKIAYCKNAYAIENPSSDMKEEEKRKIRISAGGLQSIYRLRSLLNPFKYGTLHFQYVSHRVLRWSITPIVFFILFPLNLVLLWSDPSFLYGILFILQVLFYLSGFLGYRAARKQTKNKLLYIPYYFLFMNLSVLKGFRYLKNKNGSGVWEKAKRG